MTIQQILYHLAFIVLHDIIQFIYMKIILRNNLIKNIEEPVIKSGKTYSKSLAAFAFATVISGVNYYFQNVVTHHDNQRQNQLIQRVASDQTAKNFLQKFDFHKADDWQCKKIVLDGSLREGRFLVKKNRGTEQGYIVLAPFVVQRDELTFRRRRVQRKFVLNMGWIPKSSKHLIKTTLAPDSIGENDYSQDRIAATQAQKIDKLVRDPVLIEFYTPVTTVHAYIRRGQQQQIFNGLNNWRDQKFFKYIDLAWLSRLFRITNRNQASTVYLQRIAKNEQQGQIAPMPAQKQTLIQQLRRRIELNNETKSRNVEWVTLGAFGSAALISIL